MQSNPISSKAVDLWLCSGTVSVSRSYSISSRRSMQHIHSRGVSGVSRSGYRFPASPKRHSVGRAIVQMRQSQYDKGMDPRGCRKCASVPELLPAQSPCGEACHSCWPVAVFWSSNCSRCFSLRRRGARTTCGRSRRCQGSVPGQPRLSSQLASQLAILRAR